MCWAEIDSEAGGLGAEARVVATMVRAAAMVKGWEPDLAGGVAEI